MYPSPARPRTARSIKHGVLPVFKCGPLGSVIKLFSNFARALLNPHPRLLCVATQFLHSVEHALEVFFQPCLAVPEDCACTGHVFPLCKAVRISLFTPLSGWVDNSQRFRGAGLAAINLPGLGRSNKHVQWFMPASALFVVLP